MDLKEELYKALSESELSMREIERRANVSRSSIYNILSYGNAYFLTVERIFKVLGYRIKIEKRQI